MDIELDLEQVKCYLKPLDELSETAKDYIEHKDGLFINRPGTESGVYLLFEEGELVYVGQTSNLSARLWAHFTKSPFHFRHATWFFIKEKSHRDFVEAYYINAYWPIANYKAEPYPDYAVHLLPEGKRVERPPILI